MKGTAAVKLVCLSSENIQSSPYLEIPNNQESKACLILWKKVKSSAQI